MYFHAKISYPTDGENGEILQVSEEMLVDDESFAGVEAAIYTYAEENGISDFKIESVVRKKVNNLLCVDQFPLFEFKVVLITENEKSGKEKRLTDIVMVGAKDFEDAFLKVKKDYEKYLIPHHVEAGKITKIVSYIKVEEEEISEEDKAQAEDVFESSGGNWINSIVPPENPPVADGQLIAWGVNPDGSIIDNNTPLTDDGVSAVQYAKDTPDTISPKQYYEEK